MKRSSDVTDGPAQKLAAANLDAICGQVGCQFVLGMGDNFCAPTP